VPKRKITELSKAFATAGAALLLFGLVMLVHPRWTTSSVTHVAQAGPAKVITETRGYHEIPAYCSISALIAGAALIFWATRKM